MMTYAHTGQTARLLCLAGALAIQACGDATIPTHAHPAGSMAAATVGAEARGPYIVVFHDQRIPAGFAARVSGLGGFVEGALSGIGVAAVHGLSESAAQALAQDSDIRAVERDVSFTVTGGLPAGIDEDADVTVGRTQADPTASPTAARFFARQWNMRAIFAPDVWKAGHLGSRDVVVALLDSGIDYLHPDLIGLVDVERSVSFVPEDDAYIAAHFPDRLPIADLHVHGTGAASIVASNGMLLAGLNRHVTLLAVKIFGRAEVGSLSRYLTGIVFAADQGADVINCTASFILDRNATPGLVAAVQRAANYAYRNGALLICGSGNNAADLDHNGDVLQMPCEAANVVCVSATGPTAAAGINGPFENVDASMPYTAFGRSAVDVAAPGGNGLGAFQTDLRVMWMPCTTTPTLPVPPACHAAAVPLGERLFKGAGTSWSAAHVSGVAALLVAQLGRGNPALIRARIVQSADDLGEPGVDQFFGHGRINVARALGVQP